MGLGLLIRFRHIERAMSSRHSRGGQYQGLIIVKAVSAVVQEANNRPFRAVPRLGLFGCALRARRPLPRAAWGEVVAAPSVNVDAPTAPNQNALSEAKSAGIVTMMILASSAIDQLCA
jgi:hypothetical protein